MILEMSIGAAGRPATYASNAWALALGVIVESGVITGEGSFTNINGSGSLDFLAGMGSLTNVRGAGSEGLIKGTGSNAGAMPGQGGV